MCGIAGKLYVDGSQKVTLKSLKEMTDAIAHRGPDDDGHQVIGHVGLAQRRLAIIDLSPKGHQPMSYANGRFWITFNGEVYNFQETRQELIDKGYRFRSGTDTEVMLAAYQEYGVNSIKKFRGMFAFALYDKKENVFFAARDRLGKKPFKYFWDGKVFLFASELKALLTQKEVKTSLDPQAIKEYLYWGFVPSPCTGLREIHKLPAAHYLLVKRGKLSIKRYWDFQPVQNHQRSEEDTIEHLREIVEESVRLRLISDRPVGAFLSGGVDSAIVVGQMAKLTKHPIKTLTVGFDGWIHDETEAASLTAKLHGTDHQVLTVHPNIERDIRKIVAAYEEPFGDVSAVPSYYISQAARKHVIVVLNGDGGDENFLGYSNYENILKTQSFHRLHHVFALLRQGLWPFRHTLDHPIFHRALRISDILQYDAKEAYQMYARGYLNLFHWSELVKDGDLNPFALWAGRLNPQASDLAGEIAWADLRNVLTDGLMAKVDIAAMQFGVEARSPLLDHTLVEFAATIPTSLKYKNGTTKYILRKAFSDLIPPEVINLPKRGFVIPIDQWLRGDLKKFGAEILLNPTHPLYTVLQYSTVEKMWQYHQAGKIDYSFVLWRIIMLRLWWDEYV